MAETEALCKDGKAAGHRWALLASEDADRAEEMNKLESFRLGFATEDKWKDWFKPLPIPTSTIAEMLFEVMHRGLTLWEPGGEMRAYAAFEKAAFGANKLHVMDPSFVRGFADGALEKWADIKGRRGPHKN